jgi:hypothetical protein
LWCGTKKFKRSKRKKEEAKKKPKKDNKKLKKRREREEVKSATLQLLIINSKTDYNVKNYVISKTLKQPTIRPAAH